MLSEEEVVGALLSETTLAELKPLLVRLTMFTKSQEARADEALSAEYTTLKQQIEQALAHAGFALSWDQSEQRYHMTLQ
jgi:hypothetical protein